MFYENEHFYFEQEIAQVPWIKIFTKADYKELSDCPLELANELFSWVLFCEKALREFYKPDKINIASFGNYMPRVHFHVMARFKEDAFFPESLWGKPQRAQKDLNLKSFDEFTQFFRQLASVKR